jgi:hypothetical protein
VSTILAVSPKGYVRAAWQVMGLSPRPNLHDASNVYSVVRLTVYRLPI